MRKTRPAKRAKRRKSMSLEETKELKKLLISGLSIPEIGEQMNRSKLSIRGHTDNLIKRYNVKNRYELITYFFKNEILN